MIRFCACVLLLNFATSPIYAANWPAWRGPNGDGVANEKDLPLTWSPTQNVRWKIALPGPGNSTPIIWGDRIFLTQALDGGKRRALMAFSRADGKLLWQKEVPCSVKETSHRQNPPCAASPVTDGEAVYAHFGSAGVVAYDFQGKELWRRDLGPLLHVFGNGASPTLFGDLLIVYHGPGEPTFLAALNKRTGEIVWKKNEVALNHNLFGTWSSPTLVRIGDRHELLMLQPGEKVGGDGWIQSYDPATGQELWRCVGLGASIYPSAVASADGGLIVGASGFQGPMLAVRTGGKGDVTASHLLWRHASGNPQRVGSPIVYDGLLFVSDVHSRDGRAECLDVRTGKAHWKETLSGTLWGSILRAGDRLYMANLEGKTFVLRASPKFELLATNDLAEPTYAALAASDGELFVRTYKHLYCISAKKPK